jgi:acetyl esterase
MNTSSFIKPLLVMATLTTTSPSQGQNPYEKLHPQVQYLLGEMQKRYANAPQPTTPPTPAQQLEAARMGYRGVNALSGQHEVFAVSEQTITADGQPLLLRIYKPNAKPNRPVILYLHGGGFVSGDFETHDGLLRNLANVTEAIVVSVGYRRAPEHPFPAAPNDGLAALTWLTTYAAEIGGDPAQIGLVGDSAGGDLAAVVALMNRDQKLPNKPAFMVLIYPDTDLTESTKSWEHYGELTPGIISRQNKLRNIAAYAAGQDLKNPYLSPLYADLHNLPATFVLTAEYDPQHDEGEQLADKLRAANVPVEYKQYGGMVHGFVQMAGVLDGGKEAIKDIATFVKKHTR